ncbi:hypothetical protein LZC95_15245 [Pendulispora brunnea]|uniref:Uncharacterized protein n=1 Tax=Pendulispora brunnea TaxID=2905690 RepID=A0ABZ2KKQ1_9BACT
MKSSLNLAALSAVPLALALALAACGGESDNLPPPPPPPPPPPAAAAATTPPPAATQEAAPEKPPAPPVTLTAGAASPDPAAPLPTAKVTAPTKGQVIAADKANDFAVKLDVKNWQTATGSSHVHLILDHKPYKAIYDPKAPVKLSELTAGEPLTEGQHVLATFPSRANHESVKTKDALNVVEFYVGKKGAPAVDVKKPFLIYSRPKGEYKGDMANHVLIDFQLLNDVLSEDKDHVNIAVSGPGIEGNLTAKVIKFGTPYYLDNLQNGTYTVKLDLVDKNDKPVPGAWNSVSREIKIDHEGQAEPMPGHDMSKPDSTKPAPKK